MVRIFKDLGYPTEIGADLDEVHAADFLKEAIAASDVEREVREEGALFVVGVQRGEYRRQWQARARGRSSATWHAHSITSTA